MAKQKKTVEEQINEAMFDWAGQPLIEFLRDCIALFKLWDIDDENDWVEEAVGGDDDNVRTVRLVRTVYILSQIAEKNTGRFVSLKTKYPKLCEKMEAMVSSMPDDHSEV